MSSEERHVQLDAEVLAGRRFYQEDIALVESVDLEAATPGEDINWLEDVELLEEEGVPAVFDRYSNSFLRIYFPIPEGREHEIARKVLITHLQSGNSYGIQLKEQHCKFRSRSSAPGSRARRRSGRIGSRPSSKAGSRPRDTECTSSSSSTSRASRRAYTRTFSVRAARRSTASSSTRASRSPIRATSTRSSVCGRDGRLRRRGAAVARGQRAIAGAACAAVPFWGVCLGVQLLASSLGGRVYPGTSPRSASCRSS